MLESKSSKILVMILSIFIIIIDVTVSYYLMRRRTENSTHSVSLYTAEGDTLLDLDTNSEWVKVWIGDSCGVDVWTINKEGGWTRK